MHGGVGQRGQRRCKRLSSAAGPTRTCCSACGGAEGSMVEQGAAKKGGPAPRRGGSIQVVRGALLGRAMQSKADHAPNPKPNPKRRAEQRAAQSSSRDPCSCSGGAAELVSSPGSWWEGERAGRFFARTYCCCKISPCCKISHESRLVLVEQWGGAGGKSAGEGEVDEDDWSSQACVPRSTGPPEGSRCSAKEASV